MSKNIGYLAAALWAVSCMGLSGCANSGGQDGDGDLVVEDAATQSEKTSCEPNCDEKYCGDDGCGGSCGSCSGIDDGNWCTDTLCQAGLCVYVPNTKECAAGAGQCMDGTCCEAVCITFEGAAKECGDDGCGGSCGDCGCGLACVAGLCLEGDPCQAAQCGTDGCGGSCGECTDYPNSFCDGAGQCGCTKECEGKVCGDDKCGGVCGTCPCGTACQNDTCLDVDDPCQGKECGDDGCGGSCGTCPGGNACVDGQCLDCVPECGGKQCGPDGCGGNCGQCGNDEACTNGKCQCQPECSGKSCGDDGCGGTCGDCECGFQCSGGKCVAGGEPCANVGNECCEDGECGPPANAECMDDMLGGYCVIPDCSGSACPDGSSCITIEYTSGESKPFCMETCSKDADCRAGYICHPQVNVCWYDYGGGTSKIGDPCMDDADCAGANSTCYPESYNGDPTGFVQGYCIIFDCTNNCPAGSTCLEVGTDGSTACLPKCTSNSDCRIGYACEGGVCFPNCAADADCPSCYECYQSDGICVAEEVGCSAANPMGWCPEGLFCQQGQCQEFDFTCEDTTYEPNETKGAAQSISPGSFKQAVKSDLQVCVSDNDWFKLQIPAGKTGTLGIYFYHDLGDLDLCMYDSTGKLVACRYPFEDYPANWRGYDWNDEFLSVFAATGTKTYYFKADGWSGQANNYNLYAWLTDWQDGKTCTDYFSFNECKGCKANGQCIKDDFQANLIQFPHPDQSDPFVGDGYMVEHASGYNWLRREGIMLVRHAIKEVQAKFPGTQPLGLMDMCQIDGITPGFDVGDPRHPATTHDEGGNIDIAYYQKNGENSGKVVCAPNGGATDGYFCTSTTNHIVDLPRTAYFMAKLAESPRMRVMGVDKLLAPLIEDALKDLKDSGAISASSYAKTKSAMAYGDGWPFHHHHIHVSLLWWSQRDDERVQPIGCGYRMDGDGTWADYLKTLDIGAP